MFIQHMRHELVKAVQAKQKIYDVVSNIETTDVTKANNLYMLVNTLEGKLQLMYGVIALIDNGFTLNQIHWFIFSQLQFTLDTKNNELDLNSVKYHKKGMEHTCRWFTRKFFTNN